MKQAYTINELEFEKFNRGQYQCKTNYGMYRYSVCKGVHKVWFSDSGYLRPCRLRACKSKKEATAIINRWHVEYLLPHLTPVETPQ